MRYLGLRQGLWGFRGVGFRMFKSLGIRRFTGFRVQGFMDKDLRPKGASAWDP